ncbi:MAG: transposase [Candidatus Udaeobacter sp.]
MTKFPRVPRRLDMLFPRNPLYFVTCCTYRRRSYLANDQFHAAFVRFAQRAHADFGIAVGRYVILPNHVHFFVTLSNEVKLAEWVGTLKRVLARAVERNSKDPLWQRGFFDHVLRSRESYSEKWNYVCENPVRAGLATNPSDWPYSGEIVDIYYDR